MHHPDHTSEDDDEDSNDQDNYDFNKMNVQEEIDIPRLAMSSHPSTKHYPFSRTTTQNLTDSDLDEDDVPSEALPKSATHYEEPILSRQSSTTAPNVGITKIKPPKLRENRERMPSITDSDESDEMGVIKKKKTPGEYDPEQYEDLNVNDEIKDVFQYISKYSPQLLNLDFKFKPFIPDFIPAVGDIDAFLKIVAPEKNLTGEDFVESKLGLAVLDEPAANQSDPALLHLQLRAASIGVANEQQAIVVKKVDNIEKNSKVIDKWIKDVSELHRNKASAIVKYSNPMPDIDELMQEWPERFENAIKLNGIPSPKFSGPLLQYVDILCAVFDIPIYKNKIQSLHAFFCLFAAIQNQQLYRGTNTGDSKENAEISNTKLDHLVLE